MYKLLITTYNQHGPNVNSLEFARHHDAHEAFNSLRYAEAPCEIRLFETSNSQQPQLLCTSRNA